jgi:hypothetical protein
MQMEEARNFGDRYGVSMKYMAQHLGTTSENIKRFNEPLALATWQEDQQIYEWHQQLLKVTEILDRVAIGVIKTLKEVEK